MTDGNQVITESRMIANSHYHHHFHLYYKQGKVVINLLKRVWSFMWGSIIQQHKEKDIRDREESIKSGMVSHHRFHCHHYSEDREECTVQG